MEDTAQDRLNELTQEFRWKLRHIEGPINAAENAELEAEFDEIVELTRRLAVPQT